MYDLLIKNGDVVVGNAFEKLNIGRECEVKYGKKELEKNEIII